MSVQTPTSWRSISDVPPADALRMAQGSDEEGCWEAELCAFAWRAVAALDAAVLGGRATGEAVDPWVATAMRVACNAWEECRAERTIRPAPPAACSPCRDEAERALRAAVEHISEAGGAVAAGGVWVATLLAGRALSAAAAHASGADDAARAALQLVDAALTYGEALGDLRWCGALRREASAALPADSQAARLPPLPAAGDTLIIPSAVPEGQPAPKIAAEHAVIRRSCAGLSVAQFADAHVRQSAPVVLTDLTQVTLGAKLLYRV